mmetsp:Transcript_17257/g.23749  ORF Transcript_17257/g.23749 Transcript_17257/m.23749 type:complete len:528 (-) Transcript_17257:247-1830(-)|eukprot:CAMPEP_0185730524 /NCGR_PEP_ID=MMETSP1171-20130828/10145_1 /TAXON_ID=374046 /ORGANISM="Helicotheca tamensis, Strain CCMP826" /LENGTH=527 /DNA_ID=CAMNT_0028399593 /DNA_START=35 /DNA_END=1618 /DNA_ORIENTATION=+
MSGEAQSPNSVVPDKSCGYLQDFLTVFVAGASGDLAKKKTYPSIYELYRNGFLPTDQGNKKSDTLIVGYARSQKSDEDFRATIRGFLKGGTDEEKDSFLKLCIYRNGAYDSPDAVGKVFEEIKQKEAASGCVVYNRLFYFAIPPSVFVPIGASIKKAVIDAGHPGVGWSRLIIEKPFGHDLESFEALNKDMSALYTEEYIYRIDHYLGKEMVQNLVILRFSNTIYEPLWNNKHISTVTITFKEDFGTKGRGGYFDKSGIIRDIIQNHLTQVMSLVAMEPPVAATGRAESANFVRDEKVKVLNCVEPASIDDCVIGQYLASDDGSEPAYLEDPTVPDDSVTPTFATTVLYIKNPRWEGVPFILKAGKALNERKAEIRIQFKKPSGVSGLFPGIHVPSNELVMRLQPNEAVYMKANVKSPGLATNITTSELDLSYKTRFADSELFDAYTRLILEVIRGRQATFVRDDELRAAWKIFTPLLKKIEEEKIKPIPYAFGGRGPKESDELVKRVGFTYHGGHYQWSDSIASSS